MHPMFFFQCLGICISLSSTSQNWFKFHLSQRVLGLEPHVVPTFTQFLQHTWVPFGVLLESVDFIFLKKERAVFCICLFSPENSIMTMGFQNVLYGIYIQMLCQPGKSCQTVPFGNGTITLYHLANEHEQAFTHVFPLSLQKRSISPSPYLVSVTLIPRHIFEASINCPSLQQ